ncbi:MAG: histidine--tRNA ligase [Deltaproteobacteria bacterium]|nr:histidine--tRNA ligase [Deltaproteobacteria bacterium]NND30772.1 histidine--tRNA ligase [Myxococcales bacterium]MBT8463340.1 histidine--tRNA ligase [Deltaproteobacteria bacterium]MBT8482963.1 histidine--tRNA ligase [Deltaproteobacteria bacterium]NNK07512.1 histidine--tRNA ligase [Myxococcales bacterium]
MSIRAVKGMKDILSDEISKWHGLEKAFRDRVEGYGFREVRFPIVEPTALFVRSIGETTDIVEKEMYTFTDRGDKSLTLRPEGTASAVRAYVQHSVQAREPVTKWYYLGPMYRRERPAKGRYRQFYQAGIEVFGDPGPYVDAEVIDMVVGLVGSLGISEVEVLVNSIGGPETRETYRHALLVYLTPHRAELCPDCQRRMDANPLRVLDCKVPRCAEIAAGAPSILEQLTDEDRAHFEGLQETLTILGTPYRVDGSLVRGLDYYSRTLFEVLGKGEGLGAQNALLGGGRYDQMVRSLGGPDTPAIGFAMGLERLLMAMPDGGTTSHVDVFIVAAQAGVRGQATLLGRELRDSGLRVDSDLRGGSLKSQLRRADKLDARIAMILGEDEVARGVVQLKDLQNKTQEQVLRADAAPRVHALLSD